MSIARPESLAFVAAAVVGGVALILRRRARARRGVVSFVLRPAPRERVGFASLAFCALASFGLAVVGPQVGSEPRPLESSRLDLVVALDVSRSMRVPDETPDRLTRAKSEIADLIARMLGGRVALVAFAGEARVVCPLTEDRFAAASFLDELDPELEPSGGTSLAAGLAGALDAFDRGSHADRVVLIVSDGEVVEGEGGPDVTSIAWRARGAVVQVHALLVGAPDGGVVPGVPEAPLSRPDASALARVAEITGGEVVRAHDAPFALSRWLDRSLTPILRGAGAGGDGARQRDAPIDRYRWPLVVACAALFVIAARAFGPLSRSVPARRRAHVAAAVPVLLVTLGLAGDLPDAAREALDESRAGRFDRALPLWESAARDAPASPEVAFDHALAALRAGDAGRAQVEFDRAAQLFDRDAGQRAAKAAAEFGAGVSAFRSALAAPPDRVLPALVAARARLVAAIADGHGPEAALDLERVVRRIREIERANRAAAKGKGEGKSNDDRGAGKAPETRVADGEPGDETLRQSIEKARADAASEAAKKSGKHGAVAGSSDEEPRLPGGLFREQAVDLLERLRRADAERREYDRTVARERRAKDGARTERDW